MIYDLVELAISKYRDLVDQECFDQLNNSFKQLLLCEANCRRARTRELIIQRVKFECQLKRFEHVYDSIRSKHGDMPEIEKFLKQIQQEIDYLQMMKNQNV